MNHKNITLVTALFNIHRENMDGRSWNQYIEWFSVTLKVKCPMVVFVEESLVDFVKENRGVEKTKIITQSIEQMPYYYLKDDIDRILNSDEYKSKTQCSDRIECNYSLYSIIQYSKFKWLEKSIEGNFFDSDYYFWIDAGASRFFEDYDLTQKYPGKLGLEALYEIGEKALVQLNTETYFDLVNSTKLNKSYFYDPRSFVCGTFFGMHKTVHPIIDKKIRNILINDMIKNNNLNNEQIALAYLTKNNPKLFEVYYRNNWKQIALFMELGQ